MGEQESLRVIKADWRCQTDVEGITYNQEWGEMDGATSGTCHNSTRVETDLLAIEMEGQCEQHKRMKNNAPRPSRPPPVSPRSLTNYVDPPRWWGQIKSLPRKIRRAKIRRSTHQVILPRRGQSGHIKHIRYVAYTVQRLGEHPTVTMNEKDHPSNDPGEVRAAETARCHSQGTTFHIRKAHKRCMFALHYQ